MDTISPCWHPLCTPFPRARLRVYDIPSFAFPHCVVTSRGGLCLVLICRAARRYGSRRLKCICICTISARSRVHRVRGRLWPDRVSTALGAQAMHRARSGDASRLEQMRGVVRGCVLSSFDRHELPGCGDPSRVWTPMQVLMSPGSGRGPRDW
ncbi:hypothetical protein CERSUDRAFT_118014 [Gelatoporia subvermispora B]|uniref:Uncharacterized protein n=1 Tax=Ceriporiopsis subvermispora (strain B) TaxID=914234 RepID=M2R3E2_CERS8|nr:hypothetical protein CERSUDRAFT_118014 [Gelatoporia subvermispora B]